MRTEKQQHRIEWCDSWLRDCGLPSYTELLYAIKDAMLHVPAPEYIHMGAVIQVILKAEGHRNESRSDCGGTTGTDTH